MIKSMILCDELRNNGISMGEIGEIVQVVMTIPTLPNVEMRIRAKIVEFQGSIGLEFLTTEEADAG